MECRQTSKAQKSLAALICVLGLGCSSMPRQNDVIATVDGRQIIVADYLNLMSTLKPKDLAATPEAERDLKNLALKTLVRREVVLSEAERSQISLTEAELKMGIENFKSGYTSSAFEQSLLEQMVDEAGWKERVRQNLLMDKLFTQSKPTIPAPTEREALEYYEKNRPQFTKNAVAQALQIFVTDFQIAQDVMAKLKRRPGDFVALAREYSQGPEGKTDAVIKIEKDLMPEEIDRALFEGKIGSLSPIIQSGYGYHIFRVLSRTPPLNQDFHQVKNLIISRLEQERRAEWVLKFEERLIRAADIRYNQDLIKKL